MSFKKQPTTMTPLHQQPRLRECWTVRTPVVLIVTLSAALVVASTVAAPPPPAVQCPGDSAPGEDGECRCVFPCPSQFQAQRAAELECPEGERPVRLRDGEPGQPGFCCPQYGCRPEGVIELIDEPDEIGPIAGDCYDDERGLIFPNGTNWQPTPCVSCICEDGRSACQSLMCRSCPDLEPPPGECCPRCPPVPPNQPSDQTEPSSMYGRILAWIAGVALIPLVAVLIVLLVLRNRAKRSEAYLAHRQQNPSASPSGRPALYAKMNPSCTAHHELDA